VIARLSAWVSHQGDSRFPINAIKICKNRLHLPNSNLPERPPWRQADGRRHVLAIRSCKGEVSDAGFRDTGFVVIMQPESLRRQLHARHNCGLAAWPCIGLGLRHA
jgi:hypothetical protein